MYRVWEGHRLWSRRFTDGCQGNGTLGAQTLKAGKGPRAAALRVGRTRTGRLCVGGLSVGCRGLSVGCLGDGLGGRRGLVLLVAKCGFLTGAWSGSQLGSQTALRNRHGSGNRGGGLCQHEVRGLW